MSRHLPLFLPAILLACAHPTFAQPSTGSIRGQVTLKATGVPLHHADILVSRLGRKAETDDQGVYTVDNVPPGTYQVIAHMHSLGDVRRTVEVRSGEAAEANFALELSPVHEQITVTASGREETALETFQSVVSVNSIDMAAKASSTSLGDLLEDQAGIAKRSFGPGTTRPVIRGFDGDRVLVLEDGVRTGSLSSQSGDHGEPIDGNTVERIEVVRGPASLLYGANAIGGVVNAISRNHEIHERPHEGLQGHVSGTGGTANGQGGGSGYFEYGHKNWLLWGGGGAMRTGNYSTPIGKVANSGGDLTNARAGIGHYSDKASFSLGYSLQEGSYGVPFASAFEEDGGEDIGIAFRRHQTRFTGAVRNLGSGIEQFTAKLSYTDWTHRELEGGDVGTRFFNRQFVYRGEFEQRKKGPWTGTFGFWGLRRDYKALGEEALSPPVDQKAIAAFALEQLDYEKVKFQFGLRAEHNSFDPTGLPSRSFNAFSGAAGINVPLWRNGAFVVNYTHTTRTPGLEELYNHGPHVGNVTFEIGDSDLSAERGNGIDISLRQQNRRLRGEFNFFYYRMSKFIFLQPTGDEEEGLPVGEYRQADARFAGTEAKLDVGMRENLWLNLGFDSVDAQRTANGEPLPRIPPIRGRIGLDYQFKGLSVRPELVLTNSQTAVAESETTTAGYVTGNLGASYTLARQHALHVFSVNFFNVGDTLYRNHLSFIKQFAPEMGRGVRFGYNLHFF
jgi:iron complex outermembrane receptor protein